MKSTQTVTTLKILDDKRQELGQQILELAVRFQSVNWAGDADARNKRECDIVNNNHEVATKIGPLVREYLKLLVQLCGSNQKAAAYIIREGNDIPKMTDEFQRDAFGIVFCNLYEFDCPHTPFVHMALYRVLDRPDFPNRRNVDWRTSL